eukprot:CAMPEP_0182902412 /NCGR_PEP_ID=MMETSP0034_2-20130328/30435_1 /TAXON_ID=156128 /ORGANISM="Nephroselmis pyriformis, Strain CCMP717" /LENGTH=395 /DNA_ID=CAMNT_0025037057 /DNA_START=351 /DNA_END=1534 /DNA_ORIENTATION=-
MGWAAWWALAALAAALFLGQASADSRLIGWKGETHQVPEGADGEGDDVGDPDGHPSSSHSTGAILRSQFIMGGKRPAPSHHASTVVELVPGHLLASWFGGAFEGKPDVGIYVAHCRNGTWGSPTEVVLPQNKIPCWNPVLFKLQAGENKGQVLLFYKTGRSPISWKGFLKRSDDNGRTWGSPEALPAGIVGPAKNKPLQLEDGTLLAPTSDEKGRHANKEWNCWVEESKDAGRTWTRHGPIELDGRIIQPSLYLDSVSNVRMVMRSRKRYMATASSDSTGRKWSQPALSTVPCPNTGVDAVRLRDGRILIVYNHSFKTGTAGRAILVIGLSGDDGATWKRSLTLEDSGGRVVEYSYPAVIQAADGLVHITYTWKRHNIKHVVIDPAKLKGVTSKG